MNTYLPTLICGNFRAADCGALNGNVYGLVPVSGSGSRESDAPAPAGECHELPGPRTHVRVFLGELQIPLALIRLNYACDLRYGVLVDLAQQVWSAHPIDLRWVISTPIWQAMLTR